MSAITFQFRPISRTDIPTLHRWRNMPHVSQWWHPSNPSYALCEEEYNAYFEDSFGVQAFIVIKDAQDMGYMQMWRVAQFPDYRPYVEALSDHSVGLDVFIGEPSLLHQGYGSALMKQFIREHVFSDPAVPDCIIDPLPENRAAIRSYEKVGFVHEKTFQHDGTGVYFMRLTRARFEQKDINPMENALNAYAYLWTTEKRNWVLLTDEESRTENDYIPYNIKTWRLLDIADPALRQAVIEQMSAAGCPKVTDQDVFGR